MSNITIYHNPACGTSRNTLALIRNSGVEPDIIFYLDTPTLIEFQMFIPNEDNLSIKRRQKYKYFFKKNNA